MLEIIASFIKQAIIQGIPLLYGSTGEILTEKSGNLNLGIPGIMYIGGISGVIGAYFYEKAVVDINPFLCVMIPLLCSILGSVLMALIYCFLTVTLRANQNVTGLAMTTFGVGLMKVIMAKMDDTVYLVGPKQLYRWPFAGRTDALQYLGVMFFLAVIIALAASYVLFRTKVGLHLRAVGESPATADAMGVNVSRYKYCASCIGCGVAGLGGFYYIIDYMASTEAYKSLEGLGWLSVALVIFALWRPHRTIIGSTVFGFLFSCSSYISNLSWITVTMATKPLLKMLPYLFTILVLIFTSIRKKREDQPPQSLGLPYFREDR